MSFGDWALIQYMKTAIKCGIIFLVHLSQFALILSANSHVLHLLVAVNELQLFLKCMFMI